MMLCTAAVAALLLSPVTAPPEGPSAEGKVVAVWKGDLRPTLDLAGMLAPAEPSMIALWLEEYRGELMVLEVIPHGTFINEGDVLIRFETKAIDEQIEKTRFDLAQAERDFVGKGEERRLAEEADQAGLARAEMDADWAARTLAGYLEKEKGFKLEEVRLSRQSMQHRLDDARDELQQLEKMYREDELVDATEEIVLKRARRSMASSMARTRLREQQIDHELALAEVMKQERLELDAAQKASALERQRRSVAVKEASREAAAIRARYDLDNQRSKLEALERDRELLVVRAPRSGLAVHGDVEAAPGTGVLERGSRAGLFKTIMTVAKPDVLRIVTDVPEVSLFQAKTGSAVRATLAALPDLEMSGSIRVAYLPTGQKGEENVYRGEIEIQESDPRLRPGMKCKLAIILEALHDVVLIPKAAIIQRGDQTVVRCSPSADGAFDERAVVLGPRDEENVVVEKGLAAGEFVQVIEEGGT
ncbi:MAG: hypothetical protein O7B99_14555 [Planctomycetota bacterium]|nr:hypothetical protein [Planctomycetota bacterium]